MTMQVGWPSDLCLGCSHIIGGDELLDGLYTRHFCMERKTGTTMSPDSPFRPVSTWPVESCNSFKTRKEGDV